MRFGVFRAAAAAAVFLTAAAPAAAQQFSDSYEFLEAVRKVDGNKVNKYLEDRSLRIINTKDKATGEGALHIAAKQRNLVYLNVFLAQSEVNVNIQDRAGETPLLAAIAAGWNEGVSRLLRAKANVNLANSRGESPLIRAVLLHNETVVRQLLDAGANPDRADYGTGMTAREYARRESRYPSIAKMVDAVPKGGAKPAAVAGPKL